MKLEEKKVKVVNKDTYYLVGSRLEVEEIPGYWSDGSYLAWSHCKGHKAGSQTTDLKPKAVRELGALL